MTRKFILMLMMAAAVLPSCLEDIEEVPLDVEEEQIQAPAGLRALTGDRQISLSWPSVAEAEAYRLYRAQELGGTWVRLTETADTFYIDDNVSNGIQYLYSVSSVGSGGVESPRSEPVPAFSSIYSLLINGGLEFTGSRTVELTLTAPSSTAVMRISDTSDLESAVWELFTPARTWLLPAGDGSKTVYASFQDESGTFSPPVSATIELDTWCGITDITLTPTPLLYTPGSQIHVSMEVEGDEPGGEGSLEVEGLTAGTIILRDDGRGGDSAAGDGVYESDYTFPSNFRGTDLVAVGRFTDRAGNTASPLELGERISFTDPPLAVQLVGAIDSTTSMITIRWEESREDDFAAYRIYRSDQSGVTEDPALFVQGLDFQSQTTYPDSDLEQAVTYYYRVFVVNDLGETAGSNEIAASTVDAFPVPSVLNDPSAVGATRLTLEWSINTDSDFEEYRVYRSTTPGVTESSLLVATVTDREATWLDDEGLDTTTNTYYYRVLTFDTGGKSSRSNEVSTESP